MITLKTGLTLTQGAMISVFMLAAPNTHAVSTPKENIRVFASTNVEHRTPYVGNKRWQILIIDADGKVAKTCPKHRHCWTNIKKGSVQFLNQFSGKVEASRSWQTGASRDTIPVFIKKKHRK